MNKAYVIAMCFIVFNLVLVWFDLMQFFSYQPSGIGVEYDTVNFGFTNILTTGLIGTGLALVAIVVSIFTRINVLAMFLFTEIFWLPFYATSGIFTQMFQGQPAEFLLFEGVFMTIMLFVFAYAIIEMTNTAVLSG